MSLAESPWAPDIQLLKRLDQEGFFFYDYLTKGLHGERLSSPGELHRLLSGLVREGLVEKYRFGLTNHAAQKTTTAYRLSPKGSELLKELKL